ncbi:toxin-antitoxin system HicB family antitoxin [Clostridiaceae bacterium]|nr:toxin-antitoxin system HicB family antitoxin [Clostridiaceae bacterium]
MSPQVYFLSSFFSRVLKRIYIYAAEHQISMNRYIEEKLEKFLATQ